MIIHDTDSNVLTAINDSFIQLAKKYATQKSSLCAHGMETAAYFGFRVVK